MNQKQQNKKNKSVLRWGSCAWTFLHELAIGYSENPPVEDQVAMRTFLYNLSRVLPCGTCRYHYAQILMEDQPDVTNNMSLQQWVFNIHNKVNTRIKKPIFTWQEYLNKYQPFNAINEYKKN